MRSRSLHKSGRSIEAGNLEEASCQFSDISVKFESVKYRMDLPCCGRMNPVGHAGYCDHQQPGTDGYKTARRRPRDQWLPEARRNTSHSPHRVTVPNKEHRKRKCDRAMDNVFDIACGKITHRDEHKCKPERQDSRTNKFGDRNTPLEKTHCLTRSRIRAKRQSIQHNLGTAVDA